MFRLKSFFSVLVLVALLFPIAEKGLHELGHLDDDHCGVTETHYCQAEHSCDICDYVFSSAAEPPRNYYSCELSSLIFDFSSGTATVALLDFSGFIVSPRGPPAC